jgi:hypothetical protein
MHYFSYARLNSASLFLTVLTGKYTVRFDVTHPAVLKWEKTKNLYWDEFVFGTRKIMGKRFFTTLYRLSMLKI